VLSSDLLFPKLKVLAAAAVSPVTKPLLRELRYCERATGTPMVARAAGKLPFT
jgi:hypothetical protein